MLEKLAEAGMELDGIIEANYSGGKVINCVSEGSLKKINGSDNRVSGVIAKMLQN